jgi:hypothetical protein
MKEFKAPSGATVKIQEASFIDACELHSIVCKELLNLQISFEFVVKELIFELSKNVKEGEKVEVKEINFADILSTPSLLEIVSRVSIALASSELARKHVFKCLERSLYNEERILPALFEDVAKRQDYYAIFKKCLEINIFCFIRALC